jgi:hypothetical protein
MTNSPQEQYRKLLGRSAEAIMDKLLTQGMQRNSKLTVPKPIYAGSSYATAESKYKVTYQTNHNDGVAYFTNLDQAKAYYESFPKGGANLYEFYERKLS